MPSTEHEAVAALFDAVPGAWTLCAQGGLIVPDGGTLELGDSALTSVELRADRVLVARDAAGRAVGALVVEVQRAVDRDKGFVWPAYASVLRL
ncbi:MAG: hypothetical protein IT374_21145, partial [Polyangiaceae bacterium]|nr:hypothetical protein [Polyangiaceae bacterium]